MAKKGKVMQTVISIAGEISPTLGKTIDDVYGKLDGVNVKALAVSAAVAGTVVAVGKAAANAGKYLKDLGSEFDAANDAIRIGTGATGDDLQALMDDFDAVYKSVPTTMEDASKAIADYNTRLGLTGENLQDLSKQAIQVSDMLGEDLGTVIEESSQAFQQWSINADDMGYAMDYIFRVSQSTGMGFNDLMSNMQAFGPQLQEMGYSFEGAAALMGQMDKAGVNTSEVLSAMKKSVTTLAKDGISASDGLAMYADQIANAKTEAEAAAIASEVFGARAGSTMAAAIRDGTLSVHDLTESLIASNETISGAAEDTYDFSERLQMMKQGLQVALKPMANTVFDGLNKFMPTLQKLMEQIVPVISDATAAAAPFVEDFLMGAADALEGVLPLLSQLGAELLPMLSQFAGELLPPILSMMQTLLPPLMQIVSAILPPLAELFVAIFPLISQIASAIMPLLLSMVRSLTPLLKPVVQLLEPIADLLCTIVGWVSKIIDFGSGVIGKIAGLFGGGGDSVNLSGFASGGFTNGLSVAGEDPNYPTEAIISFNPAYRAQNLSYWAEAGRMLGADSSDFSLDGETGGGSYYDMSGISFAPQIIVQGNADKRTIMEAIEEEYPEFIDFLEEWLAGRGKPVYG